MKEKKTNFQTFIQLLVKLLGKPTKKTFNIAYKSQKRLGDVQ